MFWSRFTKPVKLCEICGGNHITSGVSVGETVPYDTLYPGHEYYLVTQDQEYHRPEIWRLGFMETNGSAKDMHGIPLLFTAARPGQYDETVTVILYSRDIRTSREVECDRSARYMNVQAIKAEE